MVDGIDLQIIKELSNNARTSFMRIAKKLKLSESAIRKRVKKLENNNIIKSYSLIVDQAKIGYDNIALVGVDVEAEKYLYVGKKLRELDGIKYAASTTGDHMFMLEIIAKDNEHLTRICDNVKSINGVTRICPAIIKDTIRGTL